MLIVPVCRSFYVEASTNVFLWKALCAAPPWFIPARALMDLCICEEHTQEGGAVCNRTVCAARALRREHHLLCKQVSPTATPKPSS